MFFVNKSFVQLFEQGPTCCGESMPAPIFQEISPEFTVPAGEPFNDLQPVDIDCPPGRYFVRVGIELDRPTGWMEVAVTSSRIAVD